MPLRLNLYHEIQLQRKQQAYDPLRISILVILVIAVGLVSYYFFVLNKLNGEKSRLDARKAEFAKLEPEAKAAEAAKKELDQQTALANSLVKRMENRFYWAPLLEEIASVTDSHIQILKLTADIAKDPPRRFQLFIDGIAAATENSRAPEVAHEYLIVLEKVAMKFKAPDSNPKVTFRQQSFGDGGTVNVNGRDLPTATFSIVMEFNAAETPKPVESPRASRRRGAPARN